MSESPEFLQRLADMEPELVEGGEPAFGDEDFEEIGLDDDSDDDPGLPDV